MAEYVAQQADEAQNLGAKQTSKRTDLTDDGLPEVGENGMIVIKQKDKSAQTTYDRRTVTSEIQCNNGKDVPPTDYPMHAGKVKILSRQTVDYNDRLHRPDTT